MEYEWISIQDALLMHGEQLAEHGGLDGVRDMGLLESALARPQNLIAYGEPDAADLAAAYAFGVARNHPFIDGNKRVAWLLAVTFLDMNGFDFDAEMVEALQAMLALAEGRIEEKEFAAWLRARLKPLKS
ncbi:MAG: type II toxin-antitoxin system death-on-curing family toxin [Acidobacteriota bacterium]